MSDPNEPRCGACDRPLFDTDEMHELRTRLAACERDRLAEVEGLTAERDHYRVALHAAIQRAERAEGKLCTRCKQACKHLCSTPQADSDIEADTVARIVAWLRAECADSGGDASFWGRLWATDIAAGAWRKEAAGE